MMINMSRVELARKRRGFTKKDLAHKLSITDRTISNWYSNGDFEERYLEKLAEVLKFPKKFFLLSDDVFLPESEAVSFRALSKISTKKRDIALSQTVLAQLISDWVDDRFDLPSVNVPNLHELRENTLSITSESVINQESEDSYAVHSYAQMCAEIVRKSWGLGEIPISNMISLLESKGIRVFSLSNDAHEVDACCQWINERPFIFLNTDKSAERCRFDAAHELGHLVMHKHGVVEGKQMEQEANAFASAFLMPKRSMFAEPVFSPTLRTILEKKKIWKVSAAALTYRYNKLGLITDWNSISIYKQLAQSGKKNEPETIPHEKSLLLSKVFTVLKNEGIRPIDIAQELNISFEDLNELTFGIAQELTDHLSDLRRSKLKLVI